MHKKLMLATLSLSAGLCSFGQDFLDVTAGTFPAHQAVVESASAWGDVDNDGDLDLIVSGEVALGNPQTILYRNNGGVFIPEFGLFENVWKAGIGLGDYNNDGFIDILICGLKQDGNPVSDLYTNNGGASFTRNANASDTFVDVFGASVEWADYDNDGDLDVLIIGESASGELSNLYENKGGIMALDIAVSNLIEDVEFGDIAFGDYDNDGYVDLVIQGLSQPTQAGVSIIDPFTGLYRNNGLGGFDAPSFPFTFVQEGSLEWGDYNNDGFLDLLLTGTYALDTITKVYHNDGGSGSFTDISNVDDGIQKGRASWGDYDNDGWLDILLAGETNLGSVARILRNETPNFGGLGKFIEDTLSSAVITPVDLGATAIWGDYDGNQKLDILTIGRTDTLLDTRQLFLYQNINTNANQTAGAPQNLAAVQVFDEVYLSWDPPIGLTAAQANSLTYNIYIGTAPLTTDVTSPMSDVFSGKRRVLKMGNITGGTQWRVRELPGGTYYWNVQAVDADYEGGPWNNEEVFVYVPPVPTFENVTGTSLPASLAGQINGAADWGDFDNDGDLDLVVTGELSAFNYKTAVYKNLGGTFIEDFAASAQLVDVSLSDVAWGDYDNDGYLDLIVCGQDNLGNTHSKIYHNNQNGILTLATVASSGLDDMLGASVAWGDYNNDGYLDVIISGNENGNPSTKIYQNDGNGSFTEDVAATANMVDVGFGGVAWGDFDNDEDLDVVLMGNGNGGIVSEVYQNNDGIFVSINAPLTDLQQGSVAWGDYNNDGNLDILIIGETAGGTPESKIYQNNGAGNFFDTGFDPQEVENGQAVWGDYNNDGFLDIMIAGEETDGSPSTRLYLNQAGNAFTEDFDNMGVLSKVEENASAIWGDYNNDGLLDIFITGLGTTGKIAELYLNIDTNPPIVLSSPTNLMSTQIGDEVALSWNPPFGITPALEKGLTYNLYVSQTPPGPNGNADPFSPMATTPLGYRKVVRLGNANHNTSWRIKGLAGGTYSWSVQAVGTAFQGSPFAGQEAFLFTAPDFIDVTGPLITALPSNIDNADLSWADYDTDGDLDILLTGNTGGGFITELYKNNAGTFTLDMAASGDLVGVDESSAAWGDYNNDGWIDLILTGQSAIGTTTKLYQNNTLGGFTETTNSFTFVQDGSVIWGDYDNDGDLDLALSGASGAGPITKLYQNNGDGTFLDTGLPLENIQASSMAWGDYNNDGWLDLLLAGNNGTIPSTKLYENNGMGGFVEIATSLVGIDQGSVAWGDYNHDGFLDILMSGNSGTGPITKVYFNNLGTGVFNDIGTTVQAVQDGEAIWGDYNNDGFLDILVAGEGQGGASDFTVRLYQNDAGVSFIEDAINSSAFTAVGEGASLAWGDYDSDGKLDVLIAGRISNGPVIRTLKVYNNQGLFPNTPLTAPTNLTTTQVDDLIILNWDPPIGFTNTTANELTYQICIGATIGGVEVASPMSSLNTGFRRIVQMGSTHRTSWTLEGLAIGTYLWSVQAIDASMKGSPFAEKETISFVPPGAIFIDRTVSTFPLQAPAGVEASHLSWADYDNDDDLDLLAMGVNLIGDVSTSIYENTPGGFVKQVAESNTLPQLSRADAAWGDFNHDGFMDVVLVGAVEGGGTLSALYLNNGVGSFTVKALSAAGVQDGSVAAGDYDNDGDLDIFLSGLGASGRVAILFNNDGQANFTNSGINLQAVSRSSAAWGDYNNDNFLDLLVIGETATTKVTKLYRNDGNGGFVDEAVGLIPLSDGSVDWGDYDNDGDLDLLLSGASATGPMTKVYTNDGAGGLAEDPGAVLTGVQNGQAAWGDYDNDGLLDIMLMGNTSATVNTERVSKIYRNNNTTFFGEDPLNTSIVTDVNQGSSFAWADFDKDGKLDFALSGRSSDTPAAIRLLVFQNISTNPPSTPGAASGLTAVQDGDDILLTWNPPANYPADLVNGLTYNLYIGSTFGGIDIVATTANLSNGYHRVVREGPIKGTSWRLKNLTIGTYYWNVQAIDADFEASPFAQPGSSFTFIPSGAAFIDITNDTTFSPTLPAGLQEAALAWGDYDNDGDLDLAAAGENTLGVYTTDIYRNDNGLFQRDPLASTPLIGIGKGALAWGDYDNDGYLDLLVAGASSTGRASIVYKNTGSGTFSNINANLLDVAEASLAWGDYDNDGDLDILIAGELATTLIPSTKIYQNVGGDTFVDAGISLTNIQNGQVLWADFNKDSYLDILLTGQSTTGAVSKIYVNQSNGSFVELITPIVPLQNSVAAWGDYDNDGYLDIAISGENPLLPAATNAVTKVYRYDAGSNNFVENATVFIGLKSGSIAWGDFDNNGYLDLLMNGTSGPGLTDRKSLIYQNQNGASFLADTLNSSILADLDNGSAVAWGDYDNDGKLDVAMAGKAGVAAATQILKLYRNIDTNAPSVPNPPQILGATQNDDEIILQWIPPSGYSPALLDGLTYNLYVGNTAGAIDLKSPMARLPDGYRRIAALGNAGHAISWRLKGLSAGNYFWRVQAIDADFEGSAFSTESSFNYIPPGASFINVTTSNFTAPPLGLNEADIQWGDYDNDNDLDILTSGLTTTGTFESQIYQNNGGIFSLNNTASTLLQAVAEGSSSWGDYNNDGWLDILLSGDTGLEKVSKIYKNTGGGNFVEVPSSLAGVDESSVAWGDYDNDGDLDILLMGLSNQNGPLSLIYRNDGADTFTDINAGLKAVYDGSAAWGDYDADGDLDLILTGETLGNGPLSVVYRNDGGIFTDINANIADVSMSSVQWADFNNDGKLDILLIGDDSPSVFGFSPVAKVYYYQSALQNFQDINALLTPIRNGSVACGDYNDDGWIDIVLSGKEGAGVTERNTRIYTNNGGVGFAEDLVNSSILTNTDAGSRLAWADFNNDGKLDLALSGRSANSPLTNTFELFENINTNINLTAVAPTNLQAVQSGNDVTLSWSAPSNYDTNLAPGLSYNLYLGITVNGIEKISPMSSIPDGYRRVVRMGGIKTNVITIKNLVAATYSWSVQAVEADFEGSPFATEQQFSFETPEFSDISPTAFPSLPSGLTQTDMAWGDYDNDGDLDVIIIGSSNGNAVTRLYQQEAGVFSEVSVSLPNVKDGSVDWGDHDNDGYLDILMTGETSIGPITRVFTNNQLGGFLPALASIEGVSQSDAKWIDYDNDGRLDILISGLSASGPITQLYKNSGFGPFLQVPVNLPALSQASIALGDDDKDGDVDILIAGQNLLGFPFSQIYRNNGTGDFVDANIDLQDVAQGSVDWGDYDNDEDLDILLSGKSLLGPSTKVYTNDGNGAYSTLATFLPGIQEGSAAWGDYNDDGLIDILLTGNTGGGLEARLTSLYRNIGNSFIEDGLNSPILTAANQGSTAAWGDFDQNGKLDILLIGSTEVEPAGALKLFSNQEATANLTPPAPTNLQSVQNGQILRFSWDPPSNFDPARVGGLSYNLYVGTTPAQADRLSPMAAEATGLRRIVDLGNTSQTRSLEVSGLAPGMYYWSVQAVDADFEGSAFAPEAAFEVEAPTFVDVSGPSFPSGVPAGMTLADMAWGDYDADGDLDLVVIGQSSSTSYYSALFQNNGGSFIEIADVFGPLGNIRNGSLDWGDYDNDGDLDLLVTGDAITGRSANIYENNNGIFQSIPTTLEAVSASRALWGDYNNDGLLDILLIGESNIGPVSKVYQHIILNNSHNFIDTGIILPGVSNGDAAWNDFDRDGYLDILISGASNNGSITQLYQNKGGLGFDPISLGFMPMSESRLAWGDFNNDGFSDILLAGENNGTPLTKVYLNNGDSTFIDLLLNLPGIQGGSVAWGDYNDDGFLDILLSGKSGPNDGDRLTVLFRNINGVGFEEDVINSPVLTDLDVGNKAIWGDYDKDGKLDILLTGRSQTNPATIAFKLFQNNDPNPNISPPVPVLQQASPLGDKMRLIWAPPVGQDADIVNGLSYNLVLSTSPTGFDIASPMADRGTGFRRVVKMGNVHQALRWDVSGLAAGTYYWSVQSIDADYEGSAFAPVESFIFVPPGAVFIDETGGSFLTDLPNMTEASLVWGDYDNDRDLDLLVSGKTGATSFETSLYQNDNGIFTRNPLTSALLEDLGKSSAAWGDYDNDGDLDLVLTGENIALPLSKVYRNEGNGFFIDIAQPLDQLSDGSVSWADYNNDGLLDFVITGATLNGPVSRLLRNTGLGAFDLEFNAAFVGVSASSTAWSDYDLDGDADLLLCGEAATGPISLLYRNDGDGNFVEVQAGLMGASDGSATWGDYNNDGYPDILITGHTGTAGSSRLYRNNGDGTFTVVSTPFAAVYGGQAAFGDYDDDGWADVVLSGKTSLNTDSRFTNVYHNDGGSFSQDVINSDILENMDGGAAIAWGDYNNDEKLDLVLLGRTTDAAEGAIKLYRNIDSNPNIAPLPAENLDVMQVGDEITFSWEPPSGYEASIVKGLSYNLYIGAASLQLNRKSPMSDLLSGERKIVYTGNVGQATSWTIKGLGQGNYYWSVQSVEADYEGSKFAEPERSFPFLPPDFTDVTSTQFLNSPPEGIIDGDIAWGDFNNDEMLDFIVVGETATNPYEVYAYRGTGLGGFFPDPGIASTIFGVRKGDIEWGDYNNDNAIDLVVTGESIEGPLCKVYRNIPGAGFLSELASEVLVGVMESSVAWGDFDNDGLQDLVIAGETAQGGYVTNIYRNTGQDAFENIQAGLIGIRKGDVAWGDYDGDGDLDLLLSGESESNGPITRIYRNNGLDGFSVANIALENLQESSVAWGDYDNDGDLDILLAGTNGVQAQTLVYKNEGVAGFSPINGSFTGIMDGSASWGDFDDDGFLDMLLTGSTGLGINSRRTVLYKNFGGVTFLRSPINSTFLPDVNRGSMSAWADFNNDGKLDLALLGQTRTFPPQSIFRLYTNDNANPNIQAQAPTNLSAEQTGEAIIFSWQPPLGYDAALVQGLSYNLYIGVASGDFSLHAPLSTIPQGLRKIVSFGAIKDTSWVIKNLPNGEYYWSVQAIEADYEGSPFAPEAQVRFEPPTFADVTDTSFFLGLVPNLAYASMDWGDYDNDGDLDIAMIGETSTGTLVGQIYRKSEEGYDAVSSSIIPLKDGDIAWGDYDNNGLLDLIISGTSLSGPVTQIYRNTGILASPFTPLQNQGNIIDVTNSSLDWGDYDSDGDLDLLLTGLSATGPVSKIYQNANGSFFDIQANLPGVSLGDAKWGDFDNDNFLDVALSGDNNGTRISEIYRNEGENFFTAIGAGIIPVRESSLDWGDYNNDGLPDLLIAGDAETGPVSRAYNNVGGGLFISITNPLHGVRDGSIAWGDYNNDGFRDIILTGKDGPNVLDRATVLYKNANGVFFVMDTVNTDFIGNVNEGSQAVWGDFNNDLKLDFMLAGRAFNTPDVNIFRLYQNIANISVEEPVPPKDLIAVVENDRVELTWPLPLAYTPNMVDGLSYNLYIEKAPLGDSAGFQPSPMSIFASGKRKVVRTGNTGHELSWTIYGLEGGDYRAGIQTVEGNYNASAFQLSEPFNFAEPTFSDQTSGSLPTLPFRGIDQASIDWGDFDKDNDLDALITGESDGSPLTRLLINENGVFQPALSNFIDVMRGCARWGDYDGDGFLDILLTGETAGAGSLITIYRNVQGNTFTNIGGFIQGASESYADWGDFDNDGDLDIAIIGDFNGLPGGPITKIFENKSLNGQPVFSDFGAALANVKDGMLDWGDYDVDGDLDLLITGFTGAIAITRVYRNDGFSTTEPRFKDLRTESGQEFIGVNGGSAAWADFNNDGLLDFVITGTDGTEQVVQVYQNMGNDNFSPLSAPITAVQEGVAAWGDYNDDGYTDLVVVGQAGSSDDDRSARFYRNIKGESFGHDELASVFLRGVENGAAVAWADYDNDQKLDLMLAGRLGDGRQTLRLYRNNETTENRVPEPPVNLDASFSFTSEGARFRWDPPENYPDSLVGGLSYNIYVWLEDTTVFTTSPIADTASGHRRLVHIGNVGHTNTWTIELGAEGTYIWSVQSIDADFEGSRFADKRTFFFKPNGFTDITPDLFPGGVEGVNSSTLIWGDYNNDGRLDILAAGEVTTDTFSTAVYTNNFNPSSLETTFEWDSVASADLIGVRWASLDWGDYDRDGDLDILLCGQDTTFSRISHIYRNDVTPDGRKFVLDTTASKKLVAVWGASSAWGDYNNDGAIDILLTGNSENGPVSILYKNNGKGEFEKDAELTGVEFGSIDWGDFNQDSYLDLVITGLTAEGTPFSTVYQNDQEGNFTDISVRAPLLDVKESSVAWGDCNNDGYLDLLLTGDRGGGGNTSFVTEIYKYDPIGEKFDILPDHNPSNPVIKGVKDGSIDWGDYDGDGDLDIIITGRNSDTTRISKVYRNSLNSVESSQFPFTEDINTSGQLQDVDLGASVWGDFDTDGRLDILLSGRTAEQPIERTFAVYRNNDRSISTEAPKPPENLQINTAIRDRMTLSWDPPLGYPDSLAQGLTYNVMVLAFDSTQYLMSPMADTTNGYHRVVKIGNAGHAQTYDLRALPTGKYCWAVQAIAPDFQGSGFTPFDNCIQFNSPTPQIIDSSFSYLFVKDSLGINSWIQLRDTSIVDYVEFWYRGIAAPEAISQVATTQIADTFRFTFSNDFVIENPGLENDGDEIGLAYYFRVVGKFGFEAQSHTGYMYIQYPNGLDITQNKEPYIIKFGRDVSDYSIMSIPLDLEDNTIAATIGDDLVEYDPFKWRFFHYEAGGLNEGGGIEYTQGLETMETGNGYWLIMGDEKVLLSNDTINTGKGTTVKVRKDRPYIIPLVEGWNQIGNPYHFNLLWSDIWAANPSTLQYCIYDGTFKESESDLRRFEGAFVFAPVDGELAMPVTKNTEINRLGRQQIPSSTPIAAANWEVDIVLSTDKYAYTLGGIGMNTQADSSFDHLDKMRPPRPAQYLDINSYHEEYPLWPMFTSDIVPTSKAYIWEFTVETNMGNKLVDIQWDNSGMGLGDQRLWLYHVEEQRHLSMHERDSYRFQANQPIHHFRVYYGDQAFIDSNLRPALIHLGLAYPNPFRDEVTIPFSLPDFFKLQKIDRYQMSLKVYNSLGQEVMNLYEGTQVPGFYELSWEGKNEAGMRLAEGIYIYQLVVNTHIGQFRDSKRIMLK